MHTTLNVMHLFSCFKMNSFLKINRHRFSQRFRNFLSLFTLTLNSLKIDVFKYTKIVFIVFYTFFISNIFIYDLFEHSRCKDLNV